MIEDPYKVLGLSPDASDEDVKRAYRRPESRGSGGCPEDAGGQ